MAIGWAESGVNAFMLDHHRLHRKNTHDDIVLFLWIWNSFTMKQALPNCPFISKESITMKCSTGLLTDLKPTQIFTLETPLGKCHYVMRKLALQRIVLKIRKGISRLKRTFRMIPLWVLPLKLLEILTRLSWKETLPTTLTFSLYASMNLQPSNSSLNRPIKYTTLIWQTSVCSENIIKKWLWEVETHSMEQALQIKDRIDAIIKRKIVPIWNHIWKIWFPEPRHGHQYIGFKFGTETTYSNAELTVPFWNN